MEILRLEFQSSIKAQNQQIDGLVDMDKFVGFNDKDTSEEEIGPKIRV